ncbi:hypothetical protein EC968_002544 [Mortierella alpina]|nr:hypothetical protein EC968_002544 [Mortierella alpina]
MVILDQAPILSTRPISALGHQHQPSSQNNNATQLAHTLEQTFAFPQLQEFSEMPLLTKPLLDNSFHQHFSWDLSGAVSKSFDHPTYDYSSVAVDASMPLLSNQTLSVTAAAANDLPLDFVTLGDSTRDDFAQLSWLADTSLTNELPPSLYPLSSMAITSSNIVLPSLSNPGSPSSMLSPPGGGYQVDTITTSMVLPPPPPQSAFSGLFDVIAPTKAPLSDWTVPRAASGLGDPMAGDHIATAAIANTISTPTTSHGNNNGQDDAFCYINSSQEDPGSIFKQSFYEYQPPHSLPAYAEDGVHGCSDDELQQSIEFYERVLEQQKFQLSMQRRIRHHTEQGQSNNSYFLHNGAGLQEP